MMSSECRTHKQEGFHLQVGCRQLSSQIHFVRGNYNGLRRGSCTAQASKYNRRQDCDQSNSRHVEVSFKYVNNNSNDSRDSKINQDKQVAALMQAEKITWIFVHPWLGVNFNQDKKTLRSSRARKIMCRIKPA